MLCSQHRHSAARVAISQQQAPICVALVNCSRSVAPGVQAITAPCPNVPNVTQTVVRRRRSDARCVVAKSVTTTAEPITEAAAVSAGKSLVQFSISYKVAFGEALKLVGSSPELGAWELHAAPQMTWGSGDVWSLQLPLAPGLYELKVVVYSRATGTAHWEEGANKELQVPATLGVLSASCAWGSPHIDASLTPSTVPQQRQQRRQHQQHQQQAQQTYQPPQTHQPATSSNYSSSSSSNGAQYPWQASSSTGGGRAPSPKPAYSRGTARAHAGTPPVARTASALPAGSFRPGTPIGSKRATAAMEPMTQSPRRSSPTAFRSASGGSTTTTMSAPQTLSRMVTPSALRGSPVREGTSKLFVGNLPWTARTEEVTRLFAQFGRVEEAGVVRDRNTGKPKGMAFVVMDAAAARAAVRQLHGQEYSGRALIVELAGLNPAVPAAVSAAGAGMGMGMAARASTPRPAAPAMRQHTPRQRRTPVPVR